MTTVLYNSYAGMPISKTPGTFGDLQIKFDVSLPTGKSRNKIISILDA